VAARKQSSGALATRDSWPDVDTNGPSAHAQIAEIQRSRLLAGVVATVDELGYEATTVARITARARVSRRTFYELFENREQSVAAVLDDTVEAVERELQAAGVADLPWQERLRVGLWTILVFLDSAPALARACIVQAQRGGGAIEQCREAVLLRLTEAVDAGRAHHSSRAAAVSALTAEGLVGAAFTIVYSRLARGEQEPLSQLHGELLGMILLPYLGAAATRKEQARPAPESSESARKTVRAPRAGDPLEGVQMRMTYRTARVLEVAAQRPGASNRAIAEQAGIADQGQVSKLLSRLQRLGLLANSGEGHSKGEPNVWTLTRRGERVAHSMRLSTDRRDEAA
jgi:AcrR family transcriptional regulator